MFVCLFSEQMHMSGEEVRALGCLKMAVLTFMKSGQMLCACWNRLGLEADKRKRQGV